VSTESAVAALSAEQLLRGDAPSEGEPRVLHAGPLTVELHVIELAYLRLGGCDLLQRIYGSVRDENWDTVLPTVAAVEIDERGDSFTVAFSARNEDESIAFSWDGRIEGSADGTISYTMHGAATRAFRYSRIGFCLHHPLEGYVGRPYRASESGAAPAGGNLPVAIAPQLYRDGIYHPAVPAFSRLEVDVAGGATVRLDLEGDLFEIEDQRNWTDASFKTYCTPAYLGFPFDAVAGQRFEQRVTLSVGGKTASRGRRPAGAVDVELGEPLGHAMPQVGTTAGPTSRPLSRREEIGLRALGLGHLRVDLDLDGEAAAAETLRMRAAEASAAHTALEVALFASEATAGRAGELLGQTGGDARLARVLVFGKGEEVTPAPLVRAVRRSLVAAGVTAPVGGGTDLWFAEINRDPPDPSALDFLSFSITPQVHAFDDMSVVENLAVQADVVRAAQALAPGLPIVVSSVTLRPRNSAVTVDPRQQSLFCATWTAGSIGYLAQAGVAAATYYEAIGARGVMEEEPDGSAGGETPRRPGVVFPVYHVLAAAAALGAAAPRLTVSSDPRRATALAATTGTGTDLLVANVRPKPQRVRVRNVEGPTAQIRLLDTGTARDAMIDPVAFADGQGMQSPARGELELELGPYAVAFVRILRTASPR